MGIKFPGIRIEVIFSTTVVHERIFIVRTILKALIIIGSEMAVHVCGAAHLRRNKTNG